VGNVSKVLIFFIKETSQEKAISFAILQELNSQKKRLLMRLKC